MKKSNKNPATSVRVRLLTLSKQRQEEFQFTLERYALERLLFRLSQTPHGKDFLLKGGMLLSFLSQNPYRTTRDLDLLGHGEPSPERLTQVFRDACGLDFPEDGLRFSDQITTSVIKAGQEYPGVRVQLKVWLEQAHFSLQIDVGFGDAVLKPYEQVQFEPFLGFPVPTMYAYPLESVMTEKVHAMIELGVATSRMKDIYDLWYLASLRSWTAARITEALQLTFMGRHKPFPMGQPVMFTPTFFEDTLQLANWQRFSQKNSHRETFELRQILSQLELFWWPLLKALQQGQPFDFVWNPEIWQWEQDLNGANQS
jgi:predicted nucleotidyltransferase component of viral defense system